MDKDMIMNLAELSRVELSYDEFDEYVNQLNEIVNYINMLDKLDLEGVEPGIWVEDGLMELREDISCESLTKAEILANAPEQEYGYFKLKKIVE